MSFRLWKDKYPTREKGYLVNVEWNPGVDKPISLWTMREDDLEELRRVLDIGMGDCNHCPAWIPYMESLSKGNLVDAGVISHDMKRLSDRVDDLTRTHNQFVQRVAKDYCLGGTPCEFVKGVAEQGDIATAGLHALAKCIDDLKQDVDGIHKETDWATHMGERFNHATADIDWMKEELSIIKFALNTLIGAQKKG
jgi:hypothetical protein